MTEKLNILKRKRRSMYFLSNNAFDRNAYHRTQLEGLWDERDFERDGPKKRLCNLITVDILRITSYLLYNCCVGPAEAFHFVSLSNEKMGTKGLVAEVAPGVFVSKTKIIVIGVILLVLLILVIVLGALLGHSRSKLSGILPFCHLVDAI